MPIAPPNALAGDPEDCARLLRGEHSEPHRLLGAHPARLDGVAGVCVRAFHPQAIAVECVRRRHDPVPMPRVADGLFAAFLPGLAAPLAYHLRFTFRDGAVWEHDDPYRFLPTLGDVDLHLFNEGNHRRLWEVLGAHVRTIDGVKGVAFAVWAPNARRVSVVGDFCRWDGRVFPMRQMGNSGVFELFVPGVKSGDLYKYEIRTQDGALRLKADPCGSWMEVPPGTASRVFDSHYVWGDEAWMERRAQRDWRREPMAIYEVHFGSWAWTREGTRPLTYRELAPRLIEHVKRFGFTHIEPMPLAEHPYGPSWGYQVSGYYAATARFGNPDDLRHLIDLCHQNGLGVILDWVPGHFPKDDFALARFDGTHLYEHDDPRRGEHPDWGTLVFNYGRHEVRNFLIANALYWLREFHVDGLRVDAVASMLYLDYSRKDGQWLPNIYGGKENLEAIDFLRAMNEIVHQECPGALTIAEESTAWGGVSRPVSEGGLGFSFKWNMGWMHDTLVYFSKEPVHRKFHHHQLSFAMIYEYSEAFINPLSHDEVVHGKRPLLEKMPGDLWQKFANLRTLLAYQYTRPGKVLLFQGTEIAPWYEWCSEIGMDWGIGRMPERAALQRFLEDLGKLYLELPVFWRDDPRPEGFSWIDCNDSENSVLSYCRHADGRHALVVLNLTPVPRRPYRVGLPAAGTFRLRLNSDDPSYHGSGYAAPSEVRSETIAWHGRPQSAELSLPPLSAVVYEWS